MTRSYASTTQVRLSWLWPNVAHFYCVRLPLSAAGAALPTKASLAAQHSYLDLEASVSGYAAVTQQSAAVGKPYKLLAQLLGCTPDEIAIVTSHTTAWTQARSDCHRTCMQLACFQSVSVCRCCLGCLSGQEIAF